MTIKSGFTLIELMIVVSIIAILSILAIVAYTGFLKNSRDNKRQSDLKIIQSALEDYHADQLFYPSTVFSGNELSFTPSSGTKKTYLNKVPYDPKETAYSYVPSPPLCSGSSCTGYCLYAGMEGGGFTSDSGCTSYPSASYNYGVTRP